MPKFCFRTVGLAAIGVGAVACWVTTAARADGLKIDKGLFAVSTDPCQSETASQYNDQISFWGDSLDSSTMSRKIVKVRQAGGDVLVTLDTAGNGVGGDDSPRKTAVWRLRVADQKHFTVVSDSGKEMAPGRYRFCAALPNTGAAASPPSGASTAPVLAAATLAGFDLANSSYDGELGNEVNHNHSKVLFFPKHGLIVYSKPKASIAAIVRPGTVLFKGKIDRDGMSGDAFIFKAGCAPLSYHVEGPSYYFSGDVKTLKGRAPVRDKDSCGFSKSTGTGGNAVLTFDVGEIGD
jgi:hypothetical protein